MRAIRVMGLMVEYSGEGNQDCYNVCVSRDRQGAASFSADLDLLSKVKIIYHEMPGWNEPIMEAKTCYDLPKAVRDFVVSTSLTGLYMANTFRNILSR